MANYFYYDANGKKQGPFNEQQLKEQASKGIISPSTELETESGQKLITAGRIPGLGFNHPVSWCFNFSAHLFTCRLVYVLSSIAAVVIGIVVTQRLLQVADAPLPGVGTYAIIGIVATWVCVVLSIASTRMFCEWSLITSKAAQMYVEKTSQEQT